MTNHPTESSPQTYAKLAGVLLILTIISGGIGEAYIPATLIAANDPAGTADNFLAAEQMFRIGFACYLIEALCDITLALIFYVLLSPIHRNIALLAVLFRLVSTATFAFAMLFYFAAMVILKSNEYMVSLNADQLNDLALLSLKIYGYGGGVFMLFHGTASILFGILMYRSTYIPKLIGALLALSGAAFVLRNFLLVLAPEYASSLLLLPAFLAALVMAAWFSIKGIDLAKWEARVDS